MSPEIEDGKGADVADPFDVHGEFTEEVDDRPGAGREGEEEDEGCEEYREELGEEDGDLKREERPKLRMHLQNKQYVSAT